ncbi:MAG: hypothetical protein ACSHX6_13045 [Akkermansiaceae bacterium]
MPIKHRIRNSAAPLEKQRGLVKGKAPHREHNAHKVLRKWPYYRGALIWMVTVALLFLSLVTFGFGVLEKDRNAIFAGIALFGAWLFMKLMYFFASKTTTCPLCRANHFANSKSSKHKKAFKVFPLSYASTSVMTAVLQRCVRCMHCGVTFDLTKKHR